MNSLLSGQLEKFFHRQLLLSYPKRVLILHPDDSPSSIFYIKSGFVRVFRLSEEGEELTLTILPPGEFFPLTYGINSKVNQYYLEAITPLEIWKASQKEFLQYVKKTPKLYYDLTTKAIVRFDGVVRRMESLFLSNAYIKVASTLLVCAKRFGRPSGDNDLIIEVPLTHRDIATLVGITRETTSLEMKRLEKEGFIGKQGSLLLLKQIKHLEKIVQYSKEESPSRSSSF